MPGKVQALYATAVRKVAVVHDGNDMKQRIQQHMLSLKVPR